MEPGDFDLIYSSVIESLKTSNNKLLFDIILNYRRVRLSQSGNIILDNRDKKEPIVDFVFVVKR